MKPLHPLTRILLVLATLSMVSAYYLPMWEIQLWAPQYPEGLNMKIWLTHLGGDFDIINGLNHYIGMRHIKQEMFSEFGYMGYVLGLLIAVGLLPGLTGKRSFLTAFVIVFFVGAGLGLFDFWRWGYDYGHNLDPKAAISVPGMSYQPPIIGYKSLLNFVAYSGPDKGGWVLVGAGGVATALLILEWWFAKKRKGLNAVGLSMLAVLLAGCEAKSEAINYGKDHCTSCTMTAVDMRYGSEFVTGKGKVFKFDDVNCLVDFLGKEPAKSDEKGQKLIIDFKRANSFLKAEKAVFLRHKALRTPMGSHIAAFESMDAAEAVGKELGEGGTIMSWADVYSKR